MIDFFNINLPASIADFDGFNGDNPFAISSAFIKISQSNISGNTVKEAVVLPAPLHPDIIYRFDMRQKKISIKVIVFRDTIYGICYN
ncbi:MAG TPA: hypothetical protein VJ951_00090, partial [Bacteroidales bacterium]|nr:hypothetical protein [Bacteroidales bacterium]